MPELQRPDIPPYQDLIYPVLKDSYPAKSLISGSPTTRSPLIPRRLRAALSSSMWVGGQATGTRSIGSNRWRLPHTFSQALLVMPKSEPWRSISAANGSHFSYALERVNH